MEQPAIAALTPAAPAGAVGAGPVKAVKESKSVQRPEAINLENSCKGVGLVLLRFSLKV